MRIEGRASVSEVGETDRWMDGWTKAKGRGGIPRWRRTLFLSRKSWRMLIGLEGEVWEGMITKEWIDQVAASTDPTEAPSRAFGLEPADWI